MQQQVKVTPRYILSLAIPAIIAGIAEPLISLTDVAVIGKMSSDATTALAAVGVVGTFLNAIVWTLAQTKTSISSIVSQSLGSNRIERSRFLVPQVIALNVFLGLLIYLVTAPFAEQIFRFYEASEEVVEIAADYYRIRALGFPLTLSAFAIFGVFRGLQNTTWAMTASLAGAAVNIGLDFLLVYGYSDVISAMGVQGAAYASLAAQALLLLISIYFLYRKTIYRLIIPRFRPHPALKKHISLTANFFLRTLAINVLIYLTYRFAGMESTVVVATHAILMNIWLFFSFLTDGFANAGNAIGGRLLGSKDAEGLKILAQKTLQYGVGIATILVLVCAAGYQMIGHVFTSDMAVIDVFESVFWLVLLMQPINAVAFVFDGIFKGWGEAVYLRNLLFALTALVFAPALLILYYLDYGIHAIWWAIFLWMVGRAVALVFKFRQRLSEMSN